jgi:NADH dehydrogenase [ubiquinone] 1 alpha subcomplex assembly factor 5
MYIFNRNSFKLHRERSTDDHVILQHASDDLMFRIRMLNLQPHNILELGSRGGIMTKKLKHYFPQARITATEISSKLLQRNNYADEKLVLDDELDGIEESHFPKAKFDLVVSMLNLHWVNNVPNWMQKIKNNLKSNGVLSFNLFGGRTLKSLRDYLKSHRCRNNIIPFINLEVMSGITHKCFKNNISDSSSMKYACKSPLHLMRELKKIGEGNKMIYPGIMKRDVIKYNYAYSSTENDTINDSFETQLDIISVMCSDQNLSLKI